ncbi:MULTISPECIES: M23 family metallopeptidase [unclassified Streptomyces]|uniref:M23 family metallopeptidase n=1 Tax=unclassified Streptomyces TaxID=2593676 RepID=UPI00088E278E|nr:MULTISPECIES: M23 family metallopeptidase [unclassified Streptomyces]PBC84134.1 peptidase M23-like protein [Streptomyces sp. 2321.6]SDR34635.1 Peptidase family M23 [Streptomyces sp. KS_16]SED20958.1 Peptidase family M23 [Streptomyces sp. 2133.1]SEE60584.1 Peptidase family M23 [Streptomyces sp. 2112.3]SNC70215.1 Peptidase family M23 [Streptomyces sp. 2114.4]
MSKFAALRNSKKFAVRNRVAVVAAGVGVTAALGAGIATAADTGLQNLTSGVGSAVTAQADAQAKSAAAAKAAAVKAKQDAAKAVDAWVKPVDNYTLGEPFGIAGSHWAHKHSGQDFVVPTGTAVKAVHKGTVVKAGPWGGGDGPAYGNAIVIQHDNGTYTQYAHLSQIQVRVGQQVGAGQQIGLSGSTGNSTGPHLHFEVRTGPNYGTGIEPTGFLRAHGDAV